MVAQLALGLLLAIAPDAVASSESKQQLRACEAMRPRQELAVEASANVGVILKAKVPGYGEGGVDFSRATSVSNSVQHLSEDDLGTAHLVYQLCVQRAAGLLDAATYTQLVNAAMSKQLNLVVTDADTSAAPVSAKSSAAKSTANVAEATAAKTNGGPSTSKPSGANSMVSAKPTAAAPSEASEMGSNVGSVRFSADGTCGIPKGGTVEAKRTTLRYVLQAAPVLQIFSFAAPDIMTVSSEKTSLAGKANLATVRAELVECGAGEAVAYLDQYGSDRRVANLVHPIPLVGYIGFVWDSRAGEQLRLAGESLTAALANE